MIESNPKYTFSSITKEEDVKSLNHHILNNTFVLEITHPFPGYYFGSSFITSSSKPMFLLMILKKAVSFEFFYRSLKRIKAKLDFSFGAELAEVEIYNNKYHAIRIKDLPNYEKLEELQKAFVAEGYSIAKSKSVEAKALIKINKFNSLNYKNGLYYSNSGSGFVYFGVNKEMDWKLFEKITIKIKHNFTIKFDAGLGLFFHHGDVEDVVRIYSKDLSEEDLLKLKSLYNRELEYV